MDGLFLCDGTGACFTPWSFWLVFFLSVSLWVEIGTRLTTPRSWAWNESSGQNLGTYLRDFGNVGLADRCGRILAKAAEHHTKRLILWSCDPFWKRWKSEDHSTVRGSILEKKQAISTSNQCSSAPNLLEILGNCLKEFRGHLPDHWDMGYRNDFS